MEVVPVTSANDHSNLTDSGNRLRITCNAATQTPELPRHRIVMADSDSEKPHPSAVVVLRVQQQQDLSHFEKEAKALDIPDVVVEYIKDSCALTTNAQEPRQNFGASNPAFHDEASFKGVSSKGSPTPDASSQSSSSSLHCVQVEHECNGFSQTSCANLESTVYGNNRMYHSMPRNVAKKGVLDNLKLNSQPSSPSTPRHSDVGVGDDTSSDAYQPPIKSFLRPPSPRFGYRGVESETSHVYTIIKTCVETNDVKEILFLPKHLTNEKPPLTERKFEFGPTPPKVERKRLRLQCLTDTCSLLFLLPGLLLCIFTPIIIVPMFLYPIKYFVRLMLLFIASGTLGVVSLSFSGLLGNMVWHYEEKTKKLRLKLHCGSGPLRHFWGNGFSLFWPDKEKNKLDHHAAVI